MSGISGRVPQKTITECYTILIDDNLCPSGSSIFRHRPHPIVTSNPSLVQIHLKNIPLLLGSNHHKNAPGPFLFISISETLPEDPGSFHIAQNHIEIHGQINIHHTS